MDGKCISCDNDFVIYINIESLSCVPETNYFSKEKKRKKKQLKKKEICKNMQKGKKQLKKKFKKRKKKQLKNMQPHMGESISSTSS